MEVDFSSYPVVFQHSLPHQTRPARGGVPSWPPWLLDTPQQQRATPPRQPRKRGQRQWYISRVIQDLTHLQNGNRSTLSLNVIHTDVSTLYINICWPIGSCCPALHFSCNVAQTHGSVMSYTVCLNVSHSVFQSVRYLPKQRHTCINYMLALSYRREESVTLCVSSEHIMVFVICFPCTLLIYRTHLLPLILHPHPDHQSSVTAGHWEVGSIHRGHDKEPPGKPGKCMAV